MSDFNEQLLAARYVGIRELPTAGDAGDRRLRQMLEREMEGSRRRRPRWANRRFRIGGFAITPIAALAIAATAAAATSAAVALSATSLFQYDPQGQIGPSGVTVQPRYMNGDIETVLPSTVRQLTSVSIPDYGQVAVWGATTKPGGFCFALKLPDGDWGGLNVSQNAQDGWFGGSIPGCFQTRQQQILRQTPLKPGQQPSGTTGQELLLTPLEVWTNTIENTAGKQYMIYVGYVEAQGVATTVRDSATGVSTQVLPGGYYVLAEATTSNGDDTDDLQVLNATGQQLKPDYSWGQMLPGYSPGPSQS